MELIATNAPGGGSDRIRSIMIKVLQEQRSCPLGECHQQAGRGQQRHFNYANRTPATAIFS